MAKLYLSIYVTFYGYNNIYKHTACLQVSNIGSTLKIKAWTHQGWVKLQRHRKTCTKNGTDIGTTYTCM